MTLHPIMIQVHKWQATTSHYISTGINICDEISFYRTLPEFRIENFNTTGRIFAEDYLGFFKSNF